MSGWQFAKSVAVELASGEEIICVVPAPALVDLDAVCDATKSSDAVLVEKRRLDELFPGCEEGAIPPFGGLWDLPILCERPEHYSNTVTTVVMPDGVDGDDVLRRARERYNLVLGTGLGKLKGRVVRIGHLGALNELEVLATLGGTELALRACGVPLIFGAGVAAAQQLFAEHAVLVAASE